LIQASASATYHEKTFINGRVRMITVILLATVVLASCGGRTSEGEPGAGGAGADSVAGVPKAGGTAGLADTAAYVCPPCGCARDDSVHDQPGNCQACGMPMVDIAGTLTVYAIPQFRKVTDSVWTGGQPTMNQIVELKAAGVHVVIKATDEQLPKVPVFIHCAAAIRVGAFWMVRRVVRDGWKEEAALEEANRIGLQNHRAWVSYAKSVIKQHGGN